ncbi:cellulose binding domain-containing protein [Glycomyces xiaoerkulensis]|uniref:cellulose binding domain-containing protein n=1 Tax=Glycomyces xiaoerkulensis TaxID=2038139 RepID=UPI000C25AB4F|nr:cellulose binding domain-containing protein [Glycomyces xiaoerkulensis]
MGRHTRSREATGSLHGDWLRVLGVVSVVAVLIAVWQLTSLMGGEEGDEPFPTADEQSLPDERPSGGRSPTEPGAEAEFGSPSSSDSPSRSPSPSPSEEPSTETEPTDDGGAGGGEEPPPEEEETTASSGVSCAAHLWEEERWDGHVEVGVAVHNDGGEAISGWEITLDLEADLYHSWGLEHEGGDRYSSVHWNSEPPPDEWTGAGFQAEVDRGFEVPETAPCKAFG